MKLVLGVGVVGKSVIEYFRNRDVCFYDDVCKSYVDKVSGNLVPFFSSWEAIDLVIVSPGFSTDHKMIIEAQKRNIPFDTDIGIFLKNPDIIGSKIGITGTNGKSTLCALLKYILSDLAEVGGNFGMSALNFNKNTFYILELSSYQLFWLSDDALANLDIGVIINIGNHHLNYHKTKSEYIRVKNKILNAKHSVVNVKIEEKIKYPKNILFEKSQYKLAWNIILKILNILNLNEKVAMKKLESYVPLKYRQEIINESPLIINDSKATNIESMCCALESMLKKFVLISQVKDYSQENLNLSNYPLLQKIFILSKKEVKDLSFPIFVSDDFEIIVKEALSYAKKNDFDVLFSPGEQSFEFFKNFENRGEIFTRLIKQNGCNGLGYD